MSMYPRQTQHDIAHFSRRSLVVSPLALLLSGQAEAQTDPCTPYYGRGYCTDYVNEKTGVRQRGDARTWPSNIGRIQVRPGDVAIFRRINHVAYVEEIVEWSTRVPSAPNKWPVRLRISEMNYPGPLDSNAPRECLVTINFGRVRSRTETFDDAEFMRPRRRPR